MANDDDSYLDWLVEDIANTIEIEGAIEASRDENGKVDKWKATGIAMGLGHTSDDELATLAGLLGSEGAFDDNNDSIPNDVNSTPMPVITSRSPSNTTGEMSEFEYERRKKDITSNANYNIGCAIISAIIVSIGMVVVAFLGLSAIVSIICLCLLVLFCSTGLYCAKQKETCLEQLEKEYEDSKKEK